VAISPICGLHFLTFSCYRRQPFLASPESRDLFERALEQARVRYGFFVTGYVVMPEHVHLLTSEPEQGTLASAVQAIKQSVSRKLIGEREHFWQARYYDVNGRSPEKRIEKTEVYSSKSPGSPTSAAFAVVGVEACEAWTGRATRGLARE